MFVYWNEVVSVNTKLHLLHYTIEYQAVAGGAVLTQTELFDVRSSIISGLMSNTQYEVSVSASSLDGVGPSSTIIVNTFPDG